MNEPKEINLQEFIKIRRGVEIRIRDFIAEQCQEFRRQTGFSIDDVSVSFLETTSIGQVTREHQIYEVFCSTDTR